MPEGMRGTIRMTEKERKKERKNRKFVDGTSVCKITHTRAHAVANEEISLWLSFQFTSRASPVFFFMSCQKQLRIIFHAS